MNVEFERLLGRAIRDTEFRTLLLTNPSAATEGFKLSAAELERIQHALAKAEQGEINAAFEEPNAALWF